MKQQKKKNGLGSDSNPWSFPNIEMLSTNIFIATPTNFVLLAKSQHRPIKVRVSGMDVNFYVEVDKSILSAEMQNSGINYVVFEYKNDSFCIGEVCIENPCEE